MEDKAEFMIQGRLDGSQRNKVKGLLNMLYTPRELSDEIGINKDQIYRVYIPAGCPYSKDGQNHNLINGKEFKIWYEENYQKRTLEKGQAYCVSCKKIVEVSNPERMSKGNLVYDAYVCPNCGKKVIRFVDAKRKKNDQQKELETH
jgi:predicted RNA-binding Zn-ribbon protein involved in translation (DUF1610 family)